MEGFEEIILVELRRLNPVMKIKFLHLLSGCPPSHLGGL